MTQENQNYLGYGLIGIAFLFVFMRLTGFNMMSVLWPLWVIVPGSVFLFIAYSGKHDGRVWLAIPGAVIVGTGLILATFNVIGHWEAWSYAWTLYPAFVGAAFRFIAQQSPNHHLESVSRKLITISLYLFIGFGSFFELFIFGGLNEILTSNFLPIALLVVGLYFVWGRNQEPTYTKKKKVTI